MTEIIIVIIVLIIAWEGIYIHSEGSIPSRKDGEKEPYTDRYRDFTKQ